MATRGCGQLPRSVKMLNRVGSSREWLPPVAPLIQLWEREVAGSNPVSQTSSRQHPTPPVAGRHTSGARPPSTVFFAGKPRHDPGEVKAPACAITPESTPTEEWER